MSTLWRDVRLALRVLCNRPGFTAVAVVTLGLGIATNATVFGWINSVLLRPFGGESDAREIVALEGIGADGGRLSACTHPDFRAYQRELTQVSGVLASHISFFSVGPDDHPQRVLGQVVSANLFAVLGVKPFLGRLLLPEEDRDDNGAYPHAVVSHRLWKTYLGANPAIVGKTIRINGHQLTVVGVAPPGFSGTFGGVMLDVWVPLSQLTQMGALNTWAASDWNARFLNVIVRLKPGVTIEQARTEVQGVAARIAAARPDTHRGIGATLVPMWKASYGLQSALLNPLRILMVVGVLVLLIACANVSNLLMARSVARQREFAVRIALGASRLRLARQLLTEVLLVAGMGAAAGLILAQWMGEALYYLFPTSDAAVRSAVEPLMRAEFNARIFLFTVVISVAAAVLAALIPALFAGRVDVGETLKDGGRSGSAGIRSRRIRALLVAAEVALAAMALVGAGLAVRSYKRYAAVNPGFSTKNVLVAHFYLSTNGYKLDQEKAFNQNLRRRLEAIPGIEQVSYANAVPLSHFSPGGERIQVEGSLPDERGVNWVVSSVIAPGYFKLLDIPLLEGRDFTEQDDRKTLPVIIVNRTFAQRFFNGDSPIGRKVRVSGTWSTIVGMVRDSKYSSVGEGPTAAFYGPFRQVFWSGYQSFVFLRVAGDADRARTALRREVAALGGANGLYEAESFAEYTKASLLTEKVTASLLTVLGILSLLLAGVGLYSVMAYMVSERTQEIGIRMALGAPPLQVLGMVVRNGLAITGCGLAAGMGAALLAVRALAVPLGFPVNAGEPAVFAMTAIPLLLVAAVASLVPAVRATHVDPANALRSE